MAAAKRHFGKTAVVREKEEDLTPSVIIWRAVRGFFHRFDLLQIIPMVLLLTIGMLFVYSTGQEVGGHHVLLFKRQAMYLGIGFVFWLFLLCVDYRWFGPLSILIYPASIGLLVFVLLFGPLRNGTHRWLDIGPVSLQPSEFGKLAVLIVISWVLSFKRADINRFFWMILVGILFAIPFGLIFIEPDLGSAVILFPVVGAVMFAAKLKWRYIIIFLLIIACAMPTVYMSLKSYQQERILTFLDPERDPQNRGWNAIQAEIAVGTGGYAGKGYGKGTHCTLGYLPQMVADSDFIFPVIAEETGFVGSTVVISLYALLLFSIFRTALLAPDDFGRYLCVGIAVLLLSHVVINIGMCIRLLPITGLPLPLISYGGTFLIAMMIYLGIAQSVYAHRSERSLLNDI